MRIAALLFALAVTALPATASAAEPGVTYDPGSPAGKEYALPLDAARADTGAGTSGTGRGHTRDAVTDRSGDASPLFGVGIKSAKGSGGHSASARASKAATRRAEASNRSDRVARRADQARASNASEPPPAFRRLSSGSQAKAGTWLAVGGIAGVAVVVLGVLGGYGLRALRPRA